MNFGPSCCTLVYQVGLSSTKLHFASQWTKSDKVNVASCFSESKVRLLQRLLGHGLLVEIFGIWFWVKNICVKITCFIFNDYLASFYILLFSKCICVLCFMVKANLRTFLFLAESEKNKSPKHVKNCLNDIFSDLKSWNELSKKTTITFGVSFTTSRLPS